MFIFDNVLPESEVDCYHSLISEHYKNMLAQGYDPMDWYPSRNINIAKHPIISNIQQHIESQIRVTMKISDAELQTWPIGSSSGLHIHNKSYIPDSEREHGDFNSMFYLNDDFEGGEFFTSTGLTIEPRKNRLTFFDGGKIHHGVNTVSKNHRHTIILWWQDTRFY